MTIVAEVSAVVDAASLVAKIGRLSLEFKNFKQERLDVLQEMDFWKDTLEDLQTYARDAEKKQSNDEVVWKWLKDLEAMCLNIDDIITDLQHESMQRETRSNKAFQFGNQMIKRSETIKARQRFQGRQHWKHSNRNHWQRTRGRHA